MGSVMLETSRKSRGQAASDHGADVVRPKYSSERNSPSSEPRRGLGCANHDGCTLLCPTNHYAKLGLTHRVGELQ